MDDQEKTEAKPARKRGFTSIALQWLADKVRRTERIKDELERGTYQMDSNKIARAILDSEAQPKQ